MLRQSLPGVLVLFVLLFPSAATAQNPPEPVAIGIDFDNVIHVDAVSERAAAYGLGLQMMVKLPTTTLYNVWSGAGRLAEVFGTTYGATKPYLENDITIARWRIPQRAQMIWTNVQADPARVAFKEKLVAFTRGLNDGRFLWTLGIFGGGANWASYLSQYAHPVGTGFGYDPITAAARLTYAFSVPITEADVLAAGITFPAAESMNTADGLLGRSGSVTPGFTASNGWAISKNATASQNSMLLSDPHIPYEALTTLRGFFGTVHAPGYEVAGWFAAGFMAPFMGFNRNVGWAVTAAGFESLNLWDVQLDPGSATTYTVSGSGGGSRTIGSLAATINEREYKVGSASPTVILNPVTFYYADNGVFDLPIYEPLDSAPAAGSTFKFVGSTFTSLTLPTAPGYEINQYVDAFSESANVTDFQNAAAMNVMPSGALLAIDRAGDMRYYFNGRVPNEATQFSTPQYTISSVNGVGLVGTPRNGNQASTWYQANNTKSFPAIPFESYTNGSSSTPEIWVINNVKPEEVRITAASAITSATYATTPDLARVVVGTPGSHDRQVRARELLELLAPTITRTQVKEVATDVNDNWMTRVLPYVQSAITQLRSYTGSHTGVNTPTYDGAAPSYGAHFRDLPLAASTNVDTWLNDLSNWDKQALRNSTEAAFATIFRIRLRHYMNGGALRATGVSVAPAQFISQIHSTHLGLVPPLASFTLTSTSSLAWTGYDNDIAALANAFYDAADMYTACLNNIMTGWTTLQPWDNAFITPPYQLTHDPQPMIGLQYPKLVLGHLRWTGTYPIVDTFLDLPPLGGSAAFWPTDGAIDSLFAAGAVGPERITVFPGLGFAVPANTRGGCRTAFLAEWTANNEVDAEFMQAIGPSEFLNDPLRYRNAQDLSNRTFKPLMFNLTAIRAQRAQPGAISAAFGYVP